MASRTAHTALVRLTHWINAVCVALLLMSGLQIFNAHPALYWGEISDFAHPTLAISTKKANGEMRGVTIVAGRTFDTTGVLGVSSAAGGGSQSRAFPSWATLPSWHSLADGRLWHFFAAWVFVLNGLVYLISGALSRHLWHDLAPSWREVTGIGGAVWQHIRLRFPHGEEARRYNVLQQLSYLAVIFGLLPLLILAGLAMSPRLDAGFPWLVELFGGRQSARTVHFLCAAALVGFGLVHVLMVLISGVFNNMRSMITGRYVIEGASDA